MRFKEFLLKEAPLGDYKTSTSTGSSFDEPQKHTGAFPERDRKLLKHPVHKEKLVKFLSKTPYHFNIIMHNGRQSVSLDGEATGEVKAKDREKLIDEFGISPMTAQKMFADKKAITVLFTGNDSDDPMTPWIIAHRLGHAYDDHHKGKVSVAVEKLIRKVVTDNYGIPNGAYEPILGFARKIMTSKAARTGAKLASKNEAAMDLFAEYILRDKITLNEVPESMMVSTGAHKSPVEVTLKDPSEHKANRLTRHLEDELGEIMNAALEDMVGKVYVY